MLAAVSCNGCPLWTDAWTGCSFIRVSLPRFVGNAGRQYDRVGLAMAERFAGKDFEMVCFVGHGPRSHGCSVCRRVFFCVFLFATHRFCPSQPLTARVNRVTARAEIVFYSFVSASYNSASLCRHAVGREFEDFCTAFDPRWKTWRVLSVPRLRSPIFVVRWSSRGLTALGVHACLCLFPLISLRVYLF